MNGEDGERGSEKRMGIQGEDGRGEVSRERDRRGERRGGEGEKEIEEEEKGHARVWDEGRRRRDEERMRREEGNEERDGDESW